MEGGRTILCLLDDLSRLVLRLQQLGDASVRLMDSTLRSRHKTLGSAEGLDARGSLTASTRAAGREEGPQLKHQQRGGGAWLQAAGFQCCNQSSAALITLSSPMVGTAL